ncbi:arylesterase [Candidatus Gracilibacteria bacterium 28_42_T64]|nr:arylesterase [Candidatus Gracilibacteria bacterium 28_42_T64]
MKKLLLIFLIVMSISACSVLKDDEETKTNLAAPSEKIILAIGDSITAGYNLKLEDSYPKQLEKKLAENNYNYKVINAGVSGDTSENLLERIDLYLSEDDLPEIALIVIGGNDGLRGMSLDELEGNIKEIVTKLKKKNIKVVIGGMKIPANLGFNYSRNFSKLFKKIAKDEGVFLIDFFLEGVASIRELNLSDRIHPNEKGYKIISDNVYEYLIDNDIIND